MQQIIFADQIENITGSIAEIEKELRWLKEKKNRVQSQLERCLEAQLATEQLVRQAEQIKKQLEGDEILSVGQAISQVFNSELHLETVKLKGQYSELTCSLWEDCPRDGMMWIKHPCCELTCQYDSPFLEIERKAEIEALNLNCFNLVEISTGDLLGTYLAFSHKTSAKQFHKKLLSDFEIMKSRYPNIFIGEVRERDIVPMGTWEIEMLNLSFAQSQVLARNVKTFLDEKIVKRPVS